MADAIDDGWRRDLETVACNCCGGDDTVVAYRQPDALFFPDRWFDVVACRGCGLGFVNPRPRFEAMGEYYPATFFEQNTETTNQAVRMPRQAAWLGMPPADAGGARRPRLLDVGCADGAFGRFMLARGWDVEGVEVSDAAPRDVGFPVHRVALDRIDAGALAPFDAVTAWAVLEHVHDPAAYFRASARLLAPGGALVFLVTNFESASSRRLFREDVPRHLYFFTRATVARYLAANGLVLERAAAANDIFEMRPANLLPDLFARWVRRRPLRWEDLPPTRLEFARRRGLAPGARATTLRYALRHPLAALDRAACLVYERWQRLVGRYGIITFAARKPTR